MTFMPEDPLYYDVFSYSPPSNDRGFDAAGLGMLNAFVAKDVMQLALIENQKKLYQIKLHPEYELKLKSLITFKEEKIKKNK